MKKLHNTVLQAVIGQLGVIKSNLEGLLPTEDQQGHECITDAIGSVKDAIGDIEEAMDYRRTILSQSTRFGFEVKARQAAAP